MKKIKVMIVIEGEKLYGAARVVIDLVTLINKDIFDIKVVSFTYDNKENSLLDYLKLRKYQIEAIESKSNFDLSIIYKLRQSIINYKPDILHTHAYKADIFGFMASRFLKVAIISTLHGFTGASWRVKLYELLDFIILRFFDKIVAVSKAKTKWLHNCLYPNSKISVIYNGLSENHAEKSVDSETMRRKYGISSHAPVICTIGRLSPEKGYNYLVEAIAEVKSEVSDIKLFILGEGPLESDLKQRVYQLGVKDNVIFLGFKNDTRSYLASSDMFVLSSLTEGLPLALLEAMGEEKPVIVTNVGGLPEIIKDGCNGLIVEKKNVSALK
jgi:glycosyltransferase involved in cell wall biosynthesis